MKSNQFWTGGNEETSGSQSKGKSGPIEFPGPEELLRHDASLTSVPPGIARRLGKSIAQSPPPKTPWWRKLFG